MRWDEKGCYRESKMFFFIFFSKILKLQLRRQMWWSQQVCVCVCFCHSQVGQWRQIFEGSFWYQRYVVAMERPGRDHEISGRTKEKKKPTTESLSSQRWCLGKCVKRVGRAGWTLTTNAETWVHRRLWRVYTADGCSSGCFTHTTNVLVSRNRQTFDQTV